MKISHQEFDGLIDIEIVSLEMGGTPSGVSVALFRLIYIDGATREMAYKYLPNEVMYEVFIQDFNSFKKWLHKREK